LRPSSSPLGRLRPGRVARAGWCRFTFATGAGSFIPESAKRRLPLPGNSQFLLTAIRFRRDLKRPLEIGASARSRHRARD
jgi:hypothetical protein